MTSDNFTSLVTREAGGQCVRFTENTLCRMISYKHAITMYKLFRTCQPDQEFINLNFQLNLNPRLNHSNFFNRQNYEIGNNILLNRLSHLNNKIEKSWLELRLDSFKVKCKQLFLKTTEWKLTLHSKICSTLKLKF